MTMPLELPADQAALAEERDRAFNLGCDARLAGLPLASCPYPEAREFLAVAWRRGWWDVDQHWAHHAFWRHRDLPPVREAPR